jgi:hypothetical protein
MSWDRKGPCGPYYYRSTRQGDKVRKVYLGRGPRAEAAARRVEARRQARQAERAACRRDVAKVAAAEQALVDLTALARHLVRAALVAAGFHERRGQWRKKRNGRDSRCAGRRSQP